MRSREEDHGHRGPNPDRTMRDPRNGPGHPGDPRMGIPLHRLRRPAVPRQAPPISLPGMRRGGRSRLSHARTRAGTPMRVRPGTAASPQGITGGINHQGREMLSIVLGYCGRRPSPRSPTCAPDRRFRMPTAGGRCPQQCSQNIWVRGCSSGARGPGWPGFVRSSAGATRRTSPGNAPASRRASSRFPSPQPGRPRSGTGIPWRSKGHPGTGHSRW